MTRRWRVAVHALDRTGPPMLALSLVRWIRSVHPADDIEIVAFRGGELVDEASKWSSVEVVLDHHEPWAHAWPDPLRLEALRARFAALPSPDATVLVSVSACQVLQVLPDRGEPLVAWVVETGEDLHWLDGPIHVLDRTDVWLAGSEATASELAVRLPRTAAVSLAPEFIEPPAEVSADAVAACRVAMGATGDDVLVVGAGIGTHRKAPDLFLETALAHHRRGGQWRFTWIGGTADPMIEPLRREAERLDMSYLRFVDPVVDVGPSFTAADVFLHPARLDSFPLVCLHAAAVGTPVVAFDGVGGVPEMFGADFVGAPYPDVEGLADALGSLADVARRASLGSSQRARVLDRFTSITGAPTVFGHLASAARLVA